MAEITTIKISKKNKERLEKLRVYKRESYDEMIQRFLDLLNLCRVDPERAQHRLLIFERQSKKSGKNLPAEVLHPDEAEQLLQQASQRVQPKIPPRPQQKPIISQNASKSPSSSNVSNAQRRIFSRNSR